MLYYYFISIHIFNLRTIYFVFIILCLELATELYNEVKKDNGLERLRMEDVVEINQNACVSTCSLVLAILYLEKIKIINPEYVEKVTPSELFLVSLVHI